MPTTVILPSSRAPKDGQSERDRGGSSEDAEQDLPEDLGALAPSVEEGNVATHTGDSTRLNSPLPRPTDASDNALRQDSNGKPTARFGGVILNLAENNPNHADQWMSVSFQLHQLYRSLRRAGSPSADTYLDECIRIIRKAIGCRCNPEHKSRRGVYLGSLGAVLADVWWHRRSFEALAEAIDATRQCLEAMPLAHPRRVLIQHNLADLLSERFEWFSEKANLDESINLCREIVDSTAPDELSRTTRLMDLGSRLGLRYGHYCNPEDSKESLLCLEEALETLPDGSQEKPTCRIEIAMNLCYRHTTEGSVEDLDEAISITQSLVSVHHDQAGLLHQLGIQLGLKYTSTGDSQILNEAIAAMRASLSRTSEDDEYRPQRLTHLANHLYNRSRHQGATGDFEESIALTREAFQTINPGHCNWIQVAIGLGSRLMYRYNRTKSAEDLSEAMRTAERAIELRPDDTINRSVLFSNLAVCLGAEWERTGDITILDRSIRTLQDVVKDYGNHPLRGEAYDTLALSLIQKYNLDMSKTVLEEGIHAARLAVQATAKSHLDWGRRLGILGCLLYGRFLNEGSDADIQECFRLWRAGLDQRGSPITDRIVCGRHLLSSKGLCGNPDLAYYAARETIRLIGLSAPNALEISDKHHALSRAWGLASDAAAVALDVGKGAVCAVELLESGRNLLAGSLQGIRSDLSSLQRRHPELAESFVRFRDQLDQPVPQLRPDSGEVHGGGSVHVDRRRLADEKMIALLDEIRECPSFERFLLSSTEGEMRGAAVDGSIVVVNVSWLRCDAFIVQKSGIRSLRLPKLFLKDIKERARNIQSLDVLGWLWDVVVEPILTDLGFTNRPASGKPWPRIWWVPTGPLVQFPLHAAGYHLEKGFKTTLDRAVSSYSSSIRSIIHIRQQKLSLPTSDHGGPRNAVLVAMQQTPGFSTLANAESEVGAVQAICKAMGLSCTRPDVRRRRQVAEALDECTMFHFAGHGNSSAQYPLKSSILLEDHQEESLTIESLLQTRLGNNSPFLAYLSACGTGEVRDDHSADESIHLTSAFQLAGFRHVVGTLWDVEDQTCVGMARLTYEYIQENGWSDDSISAGLHHATITLRDNWARRYGFGKNESTCKRVLEGMEDLPLAEVESPENICRSCRQSGATASPRTIAPEGISGPRWVPYVHYGV